MDFLMMQRFVALGCGNMKSGHPLYTWITGSGVTTPSVINMAANRLIRMFPEKITEIPAAWTIGPTVANQNYLNLVSDTIAVYNVVCAHSSTTPNWNTGESFPLTKVSVEELDLLEKSTTGYPTVWAKRGYQIFLHPTPTTTYLDHIRVYGLMEEVALDSDNDEFYINDAWHPVICKIAASIIEELRGNFKKAAALLDAAKSEVYDSRDLVAEENIANNGALTVDGAPSRWGVYGR